MAEPRLCRDSRDGNKHRQGPRRVGAMLVSAMGRARGGQALGRAWALEERTVPGSGQGRSRRSQQVGVAKPQGTHGPPRAVTQGRVRDTKDVCGRLGWRVECGQSQVLPGTAEGPPPRRPHATRSSVRHPSSRQPLPSSFFSQSCHLQDVTRGTDSRAWPHAPSQLLCPSLLPPVFPSL